MTSEMILLIGTLGSGIIAASAALLGNWMNKRSEERKHYRQLIINAAVENWKHVAQSLLDHGVRGSFLPLDDYILHMMKFTELMIDQKLDESNLEQKLNEIRAFTDRVVAYRRKELQEDSEQPHTGRIVLWDSLIQIWMRKRDSTCLKKSLLMLLTETCT